MTISITFTCMNLLLKSSRLKLKPHARLESSAHPRRTRSAEATTTEAVIRPTAVSAKETALPLSRLQHGFEDVVAALQVRVALLDIAWSRSDGRRWYSLVGE